MELAVSRLQSFEIRLVGRRDAWRSGMAFLVGSYRWTLEASEQVQGKRRTEVASEEQLAYVGETDARKNTERDPVHKPFEPLVNQVNVNMKGGKTVRARQECSR